MDEANTQASPTLASAPVDLWQSEAWSPPWSPSDKAEVSGRWWPVTYHPVHPALPILSECWTFRLYFLILAELKAPRKRAFVWLLAFVLEAEAGVGVEGAQLRQTVRLAGRQAGGPNCALAPPGAGLGPNRQHDPEVHITQQEWPSTHQLLRRGSSDQTSNNWSRAC